MSIIICKHGDFGYTASLRFNDTSKNKDISSTNKYNLYKQIDYIMKRVKDEGKH